MLRIRLSRKLIVIWVSVIIVVAVAVVSFTFWSQISNLFNTASNIDKTDHKSTQLSGDDSNKLNAIYQKALMASEDSSDNTNGTKVIDSAIAESSDSKVKAQLYMYKASIYSKSSDKDSQNEALKAAYGAERLNPTYQSAMTIAQLEESLGNQQAADKYYDLFDHRTKGYEMGGS
ncbi:MAG TPA: hypothetical protein PKC86_01135 [Candidatus Saccharibacteria bacterium]|nr:hypothetical protein [Candidatus Saccharibacteria bacterium]